MEEQTLESVAVDNEGGSSLSFRGIYEVFFKPASFFKELKNNPKILIPYIVLFILTSVMMYVLSDLIVKMQLESPQLQERLQGGELPAQAKIVMKYSSIVIGTLSYTLGPLLIALLALFFGNFVMGGAAKYSQLLSVMIYGEILFVIGGLILSPLAIAKGSLIAGDLSLGILVANQGMESLTWLALSKISLFHIWEVIAVGIGLATIYEFPRNKGYVLSVLSVGLVSILHIGITAIFKLFS